MPFARPRFMHWIFRNHSQRRTDFYCYVVTRALNNLRPLSQIQLKHEQNAVDGQSRIRESQYLTRNARNESFMKNFERDNKTSACSIF